MSFTRHCTWHGRLHEFMNCTGSTNFGENYAPSHLELESLLVICIWREEWLIKHGWEKTYLKDAVHWASKRILLHQSYYLSSY